MSQHQMLSVLSSLQGKQVFLTGVTGFLGKAILEKLLRDVPDVGKIHVLIRGSESSPAQQRFEADVMSSSVFDVLRAKRGPEFQSFIESKVNVVAGELTQERFGLDHGQFEALASQLDIIINSAASVNFREALDQALKINTLCLNNILALSKAHNSFEPTQVLQISTCYVNGYNRGIIREEVMPPVSSVLDLVDEDTYDIQPLMDKLRSKIDRIHERFPDPEKREEKLIQLGIKESRHYGWNDTYTFTKWLGEQVLIQGMQKQNLIILRPSIIESAIKAPMPGWVEGVKVADALIYAYAKGRVSIFPGDDSGVLDVIPVDLVANSALMSAAQLLHGQSNNDPQFEIYQSCSGRSNPIQLREFIGHIMEASAKNYAQLPKLFAKKPEHKFKTVSPQKFRLYMAALTSLTWLRTSLGRLLGSDKAKDLMEKTKTTASLAMIFGFYTAAKYRFDSSKLEQLHGRFPLNEQKAFQVKADMFDWQYYLQSVHMKGLHTFALADKQELKPQVKSSLLNKAKVKIKGKTNAKKAA